MIGSAGQGQLGLYTNFMAFLTLLIGLGIPSALVYYIASGKLKREQVFSILLIGSLMPLLLVALLFYGLNRIGGLTIFLPEFILSSSTWILILFAHLFFMIFNIFFQSILQAENDFKKSGITTATGSLLLLLLYVLKYNKILGNDIEDIHWIIYSLASISLIQIALYKLLLYKVNKIYFQLRKIELSSLKPLIIFSGLAFIANLVQFLNYKIDIWFINYFHHNESMIGIYVLAVSLAQIVWLLPNALHSVLFTFAATEMDLISKINKTARSSNLLLLYAFLAGIIGYVLSIYIVPYLFGNDFKEVSSIIGILLFGIVPFCYGMGISAFFAGIGKVKINLHGSLIGLVICLLFDFILIPKYAIRGAAVATVLSYISTTLYYFFIFYKNYFSIK